MRALPWQRKFSRHGRTMWLAALAIAPLLVGCDSAPTPPRSGSDSVPPVVRTLFPDSAGNYDRDSNGLVDLEVAWTDSGGAVDPPSIRIRDVYPPAGPPGADLHALWRVVRLDDSGAVFEEAAPGLLHAGQNRLLIEVADTAGNLAAVTSPTIVLPAAAFSRVITIPAQAGCTGSRAIYLALSPDGSRGFLPLYQCIAVFQTDGPPNVRFVTSFPHAGFLSMIAVDSASGLAFVGGGGGQTSGFGILDTRTEQVVGEHSVGLGTAAVATDHGLLYVGEACTNGRIFVLDIPSLAEVGRIEVGASYWNSTCPNSNTFAFSEDGTRAWAGISDGGMIRLDLVADTVLEQIDLDSGTSWLGNARDLALARDRWLLVARVRAGLDEYDVTTGAKTAHVPPPTNTSLSIRELALSPDGRTLFATADTNHLTTGVVAPIVYNVPGLVTRTVLPARPTPIFDAAVFHPDGQRVFMNAGRDVWVYLVRPSY